LTGCYFNVDCNNPLQDPHNTVIYIEVGIARAMLREGPGGPRPVAPKLEGRKIKKNADY